MIQSSSKGDSQMQWVEYSQHYASIAKFRSHYNSLKFRLLYESKYT